ncbi:hypothetical protein ABL78_0126 [Leptomonas seymouri]|uniref:Uncharacterized protein n=1 Tax=Leptomonas seymouri TaxID=5684 RepID=A0A0N1I428_LEPSE|nr:hypothetical protein ABL78_0126 [Leptomonas seymouri]|eukprot:KPI90690.1 hypothetical protein ABL78_0126 [Leptomonas seymouri]
MPFRVGTPTRLAGKPSLSTRVSSPSSKNPNSRRTGCRHTTTITNAPPPNSPSQGGASSPSPIAAVPVNASRARARITNSPRRLSGSVNGFPMHRQALPCASVDSSRVDVEGSSSAAPSGYGRSQRLNSVPTLFTTASSTYSPMNSVVTIDKKPAARPNGQTLACLLLRSSSEDRGKGNGGSARHSGCRPLLSNSNSEGTASSGRRRRRTRPSAEEAEHGSSRASSSRASSPLLHPAESPVVEMPLRQLNGTSPLLFTVPMHRGAAAAGPALGIERGRLSSTHTSATYSTGTSDRGRHSDESSFSSPFRFTLPLGEGGGERREKKGGGTLDPAPASADKPWLSKPGGGILKRRRALRLRTGPMTAASTPTAMKLSLGTTAPSLTSNGATTSRSSSVQHLRLSRHVRFDEAKNEYLEASPCHSSCSDSPLYAQLGNEEWDSVMLSSSKEPVYDGEQQADTGTVLPTGKTKPSAWGADSEWFNAEFGAQMEPHAHHSDLSPSKLHAAIIGIPGAAASELSPSSLLNVSTPHCGPASPSTPIHHTLHTPTSAHGGHSKRQSFSASGARQRKSPLSTTTNGKSNCSKDEQPQLRPPTPPGPPHNSNNATEAASKEGEGETRGSSPVLVYERDPNDMEADPQSPLLMPQWGLNSLTHTTPPTAASLPAAYRANDALVPAPPLSVGALRQRSSLAKASPSTSPSPRRVIWGSCCRSSGSHQRLSSPGVSFGNVDFRSLSIGDDFDPLGGVERKGFFSATAPPLPRLQASGLLAIPVTKKDVEGSDASESSSSSVLQLSDAERRLLRAVMHTNEQSRRTRAQNNIGSSSPRAATVAGASTTSANREGNGTRVLRESVRTLGDPRNELLSSDIRHFLRGDSTKQRGAKKDRQRRGWQ